MRTTFQRLGSAFVGMAVCATFLAACGSSNSANSNVGGLTPTPLPPNTVVIDGNSGLFMPFISVIASNSTLTFTNLDTVAHDIKTVPVADKSEAAFVNLGAPVSKAVNGGQSTTLTFTQPGIYDFYDDTQATIDPTYHRVSANKNAAGFPYAPEAVVWVKGSINDLPAKALNSVIAGNDAFQLDFVAVKQGGTVSWHNYDSDPHYVTQPTSFDGLNPSQIGDGANKLLGKTDAPPNGETKSYTFGTAGLYYYYCTAHADFDSTLNRAKAHDNASIFPIPMEGFVLVI